MPKTELIDKIITLMKTVFNDNLLFQKFTNKLKDKCNDNQNFIIEGSSIKYFDDAVIFDIDLLKKKLYYKENQEHIYNGIDKGSTIHEMLYSERENTSNLLESIEFQALYNYTSSEGEIIKQKNLHSKYNTNQVYKNNERSFSNHSIHYTREENSLEIDNNKSANYSLICELYYLDDNRTLKIVNEEGNEKYFYCYKDNEKELSYEDAKQLIEDNYEYEPCKIRK